MHVIFVRARSITGIITENISCLFRKFADPTRMFSSEIQLRFSEIYVSMSLTVPYRLHITTTSTDDRPDGGCESPGLLRRNGPIRNRQGAYD